MCSEPANQPAIASRSISPPSGNHPVELGNRQQGVSHAERPTDVLARPPVTDTADRTAAASIVSSGFTLSACPSSASAPATTARTARRGRTTSASGAGVGERSLDELLLAHAVAHALGPAVELGLEPVEVRRRRPRARRSGSAQGARAPRRESRSTVACQRLHVDVRRGRDRKDVRRARHAHPCRVACEQGAVAEVADVVRRVALRRERVPTEHVPARNADVLLRTGASSPQSESNRSPYSRRADRSSRDGSTRCGAPISDTQTVKFGCMRTIGPAAPA